MHFHLDHFWHATFPKNHAVREVYLNYLLKVMGKSMISIFVPLYLFKLGFSLSLIMVFYLLLSVAQATFVFVAARFCAGFGIKRSILFSTFVLVGYYVLLLLLPRFPAAFYLIPVLFGISEAFYWIPFHALFAKGLDHDRLGKEYGVFEAFGKLAETLGPIIGGVLITLIGFQVPFLIGLLFLFVSFIPLFLSRDFLMNSRCSINTDIHQFDFRVLFGLLGSMESRAVSTFWPIFIFSILGNYVFVGGVSTLGLLVSMASMAVAGWLYDRHGLRLLFLSSTLVRSFLNLVRAFIRTPLQVVGLELVIAPPHSLQSIGYSAKYYDAAKKSKDIVVFTVLREVMIHLGMAIFCLAFAIIFQFTQRIELAFFAAAIGNLIHLLILKKKPIRLKHHTF